MTTNISSPINRYRKAVSRVSMPILAVLLGASADHGVCDGLRTAVGQNPPAEPQPVPRAEPGSEAKAGPKPEVQPTPLSAEAEQKARRLFDELFGAEFNKASASRDNAMRLAVARQLAESVPLTREDPPLWAMLTLRIAELASGSAADKAGLELAADVLTQRPPEGVDPLPRLTRAADVLDRLMRLERGPERTSTAHKLIDVLMTLADLHAATSHFDDAAACLTKATTAARLAQIAEEVLPRIKECETSLAVARKEATVLNEARKVLATNPNDPTANVMLGLHEYFDQQNTLAAAGFLAKGEAGFKALAEALLTEPADPVKLGDGFRTTAELDAAKKYKMLMLVEARKHYQNALDANPTVPDALKLKLLLAQLAEKTKGFTPTVSRVASGRTGIGSGKLPWSVAADFVANSNQRWAPLPRNATLQGVRADGKLWLIIQGRKPHVFDPITGRSVTLDGGPETPPREFEFSSDGRKVFHRIQNQVHFWDTNSAKHLYSRPLHEGLFAVSPDSKTLVLPTAERTVKLLALDSGTETRSIPTTNPITAMTFSPDGRAVVLGYNTGNIDCFEIASGKKLFGTNPDAAARRHTAVALAFTPDATTLLLGHQSGLIELWEIASAKVRGTLNEPERPTELVVSPNSSHVAVISHGDRPIRVYDLTAGKLLATLDVDRKKGLLVKVAFSTNGKHLVGWYSQGETQVWTPQAAASSPSSGPASKKRAG